LLMASQPSSPTLLSAFHLLLRQFFG
jgi:hypothetical protein